MMVFHLLGVLAGGMTPSDRSRAWQASGTQLRGPIRERKHLNL